MKTLMTTTAILLVSSAAYAWNTPHQSQVQVQVQSQSQSVNNKNVFKPTFNPTNVNVNTNVFNPSNYNKNVNVNKVTAKGGNALAVANAPTSINVSFGGGGGSPGSASPIYAPVDFGHGSYANYGYGGSFGSGGVFFASPYQGGASNGWGFPGGSVGTKHYDSSMPPPKDWEDVEHLTFKDGATTIHISYSEKTLAVSSEFDGTTFDRFRQYGPIEFYHHGDEYIWSGPLHTNENVVMSGRLAKTDKGWTYEETQDVGGASHVFTRKTLAQ